MSSLYRTPTSNSLTYTLNSTLAQSATSMTLSADVTGIVRTPGVLVIDRVDTAGNKTSTVREYISFTGQSTNTLTGLTRGLAGSTDQQHNVGAIIEFGPDTVQAEAVYQVVTTEHSTMGVHTSLVSVSTENVQQLVVPSTASIAFLNTPNLITPSTATVNLINVNTLNVASLASLQQVYITNLINASGASIVGISATVGDAGVKSRNFAPTWKSATLNSDASSNNTTSFVDILTVTYVPSDLPVFGMVDLRGFLAVKHSQAGSRLAFQGLIGTQIVAFAEFFYNNTNTNGYGYSLNGAATVAANATLVCKIQGKPLDTGVMNIVSGATQSRLDTYYYAQT